MAPKKAPTTRAAPPGKSTKTMKQKAGPSKVNAAQRDKIVLMDLLKKYPVLVAKGNDGAMKKARLEAQEGIMEDLAAHKVVTYTDTKDVTKFVQNMRARINEKWDPTKTGNLTKKPLSHLEEKFMQLVNSDGNNPNYALVPCARDVGVKAHQRRVENRQKRPQASVASKKQQAEVGRTFEDNKDVAAMEEQVDGDHGADSAVADHDYEVLLEVPQEEIALQSIMSAGEISPSKISFIFREDGAYDMSAYSIDDQGEIQCNFDVSVGTTNAGPLPSTSSGAPPSLVLLSPTRRQGSSTAVSVTVSPRVAKKPKTSGTGGKSGSSEKKTKAAVMTPIDAAGILQMQQELLSQECELVKVRAVNEKKQGEILQKKETVLTKMEDYYTRKIALLGRKESLFKKKEKMMEQQKMDDQ